MKKLLSIVLALASLHAIAGDKTIDDLSSISLNLDQSTTEAHDVHYPNYRMGGGNAAGREIRDCLMLDIRHSDAIVKLDQKLKIARALHVGEDNGLEGLAPTVQGKHVVFKMSPGNAYMTSIVAKTRSGKPLNEVLGKLLPPVRPGNDSVAPTALVYVRDCRF